VITGAARRRRWSTEQKLRIIEESFAPAETVSSVARRTGMAPNLLFRWRRLLNEGGVTAVGSAEAVVGSSQVRRLEERGRELERLLGRKTMENEILREALAKAQAKKPTCCRCRGTISDEADRQSAAGLALQPPGQVQGQDEDPYFKAEDASLLPLIRRFVDEQPTYGYRRITALVNRELARQGRQSQAGAPDHAAGQSGSGAPYRLARGARA
jgi:transposase